MRGIAYISDTEEIVEESKSLCQDDVMAALQLSESWMLPPAVSAKNFPGGWSQVFNAHGIKESTKIQMDIPRIFNR